MAAHGQNYIVESALDRAIYANSHHTNAAKQRLLVATHGMVFAGSEDQIPAIPDNIFLPSHVWLQINYKFKKSSFYISGCLAAVACMVTVHSLFCYLIYG